MGCRRGGVARGAGRQRRGEAATHLQCQEERRVQARVADDKVAHLREEIGESAIDDHVGLVSNVLPNPFELLLEGGFLVLVQPVRGGGGVRGL